ncbi:peptidoglycan LD-endopeptidase CwlK [Gammaproteobacteria bacterium]
MISSRSINDLHPVVRKLCRQFVQKCSDNGISMIITCAYRDHAAQLALFNQGRTTPGKIVTKARPGESFHNFKVAFDFVPSLNGKPVWNDVELFKRCGEIAESVGMGRSMENF